MDQFTQNRENNTRKREYHSPHLYP